VATRGPAGDGKQPPKQLIVHDLQGYNTGTERRQNNVKKRKNKHYSKNVEKKKQNHPKPNHSEGVCDTLLKRVGRGAGKTRGVYSGPRPARERTEGGRTGGIRGNGKCKHSGTREHQMKSRGACKRGGAQGTDATLGQATDSQVGGKRKRNTKCAKKNRQDRGRPPGNKNT